MKFEIKKGLETIFTGTKDISLVVWVLSIKMQKCTDKNNFTHVFSLLYIVKGVESEDWGENSDINTQYY